ncbi:hypothetical protein ANN_15569 [Periplaneta americana]|uniref:Uncharacterized protein n=1 Tax=Periplaneta americana TaxID=6978 RepID=A0ABQ8SHQ6_PERAM|nr:hypothetical protein ANN_15569 [Periplaneta americana]
MIYNKHITPGSAKSSQDRERAYRPTYGFHCGQYTCTLQSISGGTYRGRLGAPVHCILHQEYLCAKNMNLSNVMDVVMRTINFIRSKGLNHRDFRALLDGINSMGIYSTIPRKIFEAKRDEVIGEWRNLHNAELHALYSSPNLMRNIKSRRLRWAGHVACIGESRNAYRVLIGRPEGKRPLGRPRCRWEDNIKMDLREDAVSTTRLFSGDGIDDSEIFGELRPRIRHRLPDICLMVGENLGKTPPDKQLKRESNPRPNATPDRQASALADRATPVVDDDTTMNKF